MGNTREEQVLKGHEKVTMIIDEYCIDANKEAKKIVDSLKENCETYGELTKEIQRLKTDIIWGGKVEIIPIMNICEVLVKEEMNDLKIITEEKMTLNDIRKKYDLPEEEGDMNNSILVKVKLDKQYLEE